MTKSAPNHFTSQLTVVTTAPSKLRGDKSLELIEKGIPLDKLQSSFEGFLNGLQQIISVQQTRVGDFVLDEITFSAEISADGEFKLLGTGFGLSGTSGVTFKLKRERKRKESAKVDGD